jgi:glycyl-tRNA synthetase
MHPTVWKASGHVDAFNDPMIDNKDSKKRYRADVLIEDHLQKIEDKIRKEVDKARQRFGESFDEQVYVTTNPRVMEYQGKMEAIKTRFYASLDKNDLGDVKALIEELGIVCPVSGTKNWTDVRQFNLMFSTQMGSVNEDGGIVYLRPETAQGIFVNFLNVMKSARMKIPFGIAQTGKAFRNEIVARQFLFRMREFEQMEMQYFIKPGEELRWFAYWKEERMKWHISLGMPVAKYRFHDHDKLAHYANAATDIEFEFPIGFKEIEGIHSRTDFDLGSHQKFSGKKLQYFDQETNEGFVPYVVETSIGLDRTFLAVLSNAYKEEKLEDGSDRVVLGIPAFLAPIKFAILPLVKKDGLPEKAREIMDILKYHHRCYYEEKDTIGRRYRRMDAIGTPYCLTIDHQTLQDNTVTIRDRDTMAQQRIPIEGIAGIVGKKVNPVL